MLKKTSQLTAAIVVSAAALGVPSMGASAQAASSGSALASHNEAASKKFTLTNDYSNQCMKIKGDSKANGAAVVQNTCNPSRPNKSKYFKKVGKHIVNVRSGKCLGIKGGKVKKGAKIVQKKCSKAADLNWKFYNKPEHTRTIMPAKKPKPVLEMGVKSFKGDVQITLRPPAIDNAPRRSG